MNNILFIGTLLPTVGKTVFLKVPCTNIYNKNYNFLLRSWSILQDFHHDPSVLISDPALISLACIQLSLQTYGIAIPYADSQRPWHLVRILYKINLQLQSY